MQSYSRTHLADHVLDQNLATSVTQADVATATLLADLAESDIRQRHLPLGYPTMTMYCMHRFGMSEEVAFKRLRVARTAHRFPAVYHSIAKGELSLSAVLLLAPQLTDESVGDLLAAAAHRTSAEIRALLAERSAPPELPAAGLETLCATPEASPASAFSLDLNPLAHAAAVVSQRVTPPTTPSPLAPTRRLRPVMLDDAAHELLRRAQELLGHALPSGDPSRVIERALTELIDRLERRRFGKTHAPRAQKRPASGRGIPSHIRREVYEHDGGRCTFVGTQGHRCDSRSRIEFDHTVPVARGGESTVENLRLRCRAHNQYEAERVFGAMFMQGKREQTPVSSRHRAKQSA